MDLQSAASNRVDPDKLILSKLENIVQRLSDGPTNPKPFVNEPANDPPLEAQDSSPHVRSKRGDSKTVDGVDFELPDKPQPLEGVIVICSMIFSSMCHLQSSSSRVLALNMILEMSRWTDDEVKEIYSHHNTQASLISNTRF